MTNPKHFPSAPRDPQYRCVKPGMKLKADEQGEPEAKATRCDMCVGAMSWDQESTGWIYRCHVCKRSLEVRPTQYKVYLSEPGELDGPVSTPAGEICCPTCKGHGRIRDGRQPGGIGNCDRCQGRKSFPYTARLERAISAPGEHEGIFEEYEAACADALKTDNDTDAVGLLRLAIKADKHESFCSYMDRFGHPESKDTRPDAACDCWLSKARGLVGMNPL